MQSDRNHLPRPGPGPGSGSAKRPRQRQLQLGRGLLVDDIDNRDEKRQRFRPCPVCNRTFALFRLEDHVNQCLDSPPEPPRLSSSSSSSPTAFSVARHGSPSPYLHLPLPIAAADFLSPSCTRLYAPPSSRPCQRLEHHGPGSPTGGAPCLASATAEAEPCRLSILEPTQDGQESLTASAATDFKPLLVEEEAGDGPRLGGRRRQNVSPHYTDESCGIREDDGCGIKMEQYPFQTPAGAGRGALGSAAEREGNGEDRNDGATQFEFSSSQCSRNESGVVRDYGNLGAASSAETGRIEQEGQQDRHLIGNGNTKDLINGSGRAVDRPPVGFKLFQKQVQSQARLSMFHKFSPSANLQRKPTVTVLQPGMVLFRSCLDLETQQKFVMESQDVEHLFHRATTSGGGKYHVYSMCWGAVPNATAYPQLSGIPAQPLPPWMFSLAQKLALDAHQHSAVCASGCKYAPDIALANFYPAKAEELGVVGLGGHQDLNDNNLMPVVSVSVGDSMTFFYRRLPPLSRRKSGISISVDEKAVRSCKDGDTAYNREHQILLESGDVLVFGGESRLVYHGTRSVQPGTRPPGLHIVPGRLNFTFRQTR